MPPIPRRERLGKGKEKRTNMEQSRPKTFAEVLSRYQQGERDFSELDLDEDPNADLQGASLDGADFSRSCIVASFQSASLRGTRFVDANVKTCDFRNAELRGADFSGAALCSTCFEGAQLDGAKFKRAYYHSYKLGEDGQPDW